MRKQSKNNKQPPNKNTQNIVNPKVTHKESAIDCGDVSTKTEFTKEDLEYVTLLDDVSTINAELFDNTELFKQKGNIYALYAEGVLKNQPTGADLGIYDYKPVEEFNIEQNNTIVQKYSKDYKPEKIDGPFSNYDTEFDKSSSLWQSDYDCGKCMLAEGNPLGGEDSKIVITFKGYLEVSKLPFSVIRKSDAEPSQLAAVYMPQYYVSKYQLRHGDEILCTCKESEGRMLMDSLLSINQIPYYNWNCDRPWFNDLKANNQITSLSTTSEYFEPIITKFGLNKGDNVFVYINRNSQKAPVLDKLVDELSEMFDKIIYINPYCESNCAIGKSNNIIRFCTNVNADTNSQITISLLGANYARRLIELGQSVAIVIDDIDAIAALDKEHIEDMPLCKTLLSSAKATKDGATTLFTLISLRSDIVNKFTPHTIFKGVETLGVVIDNNEVDLYNSYRI